MIDSSDTRGFVLPFCLVVLTILEAVAAGVMFAVLTGHRSGAHWQALAAVQADADAALARAHRAVRPTDVVDLRLMGVDTLAVPESGLVVTRWSDNLFEAIVSKARPGVGLRSTGQFLRITPGGTVLRRAFSSPAEPVVAAGAVLGSGGMSCHDALDLVADSGIVAGAYEDLDEWASVATVVLPSGPALTPTPSFDGDCLTVDLNWGDPSQNGSPCAAYLPVVLAPEDLEVAGGVGQGVLVVRGDLTVSGGFRYSGLVLVGGRLRIWGTGAEIDGAVQAGTGSGEASDLGRATTIRYSPCAVGRATLRSGHLERVTGMAWHWR